MITNTCLIRRLAALAAVVVSLALPAVAQAQGQVEPLLGCKNRSERFASLASDGKVLSVTGSPGLGQVVIICDGTSIYADRITIDEQLAIAEGAGGGVLVIQEGLRVNADRVEMDRKTHLAVFHNVVGTARLTEEPASRSLFGGMEPEVWFMAEKIERLSAHSYRLTNGRFSTCVQSNPRWEMRGTSGTIVLDERVVLRNASFRVKSVPVLYVPYLYYPLSKEDRATGFLMPSYSSSDVRGQGFSGAFFWALNRSHDATFYYDFFTRAGQGFAADYRYAAAAGSQGSFRVYTLQQKERLANDGSVELPAARHYDIKGAMHQALGRHFNLAGNVDYFSDATSQQLYQQNVADFTQSTRSYTFTLTGSVKELNITALVDRQDRFNNLTSASRLGHAPRVTLFYSKQPIPKISFRATGDVGYTDIRENLNDPSKDKTLWRFDGSTTVRAPLSSLAFLQLTTSATWRVTRWLESLDTLTGLPTAVPLTRSLFDLGAEMRGPSVERVFQTPASKFTERLKHQIEPNVRIRWLSPFDQKSQIILTDNIDTVATGSTQISYSLTNRLMARVRRKDAESVQREILSVLVGQTYYSDAAASLVDPSLPFSAANTKWGLIQIAATFRPGDRVSGTFNMFVHPIARAIATTSANATFFLPQLQMTAGWAKREFLPGIPSYDNPILATHFVNASTTVGNQNGRVSGTYGFTLDLKQGTLMQQRFVVHYNAQCCGFAVDYQLVNLAQLGLASAPVDRRFAVTFTLAGIGSFSPPLGGFGR